MTRVAPEEVRTVICVGAGVIGGGWVAYFLARGYRVVAWDPAADAEQRLRHLVTAAWPALTELGLADGASLDNLIVRARPGDGLRPGGLRPGERAGGPRPQAHPARRHRRGDPGGRRHLVVDLGLRDERDAGQVRPPRAHRRRAPVQPAVPDPAGRGRRRHGHLGRRGRVDLGRSSGTAGKSVITMKREVPGFVANRLQEALWREALHMVENGEATVEEIDLSITDGPGLRWAAPGADAHLPPGRRPGRDGAHARPLRAVAALALDPSGRTGADVGAARRRGRRAASGRRTAAPSTTWSPSGTAA